MVPSHHCLNVKVGSDLGVVDVVDLVEDHPLQVPDDL